MRRRQFAALATGALTFSKTLLRQITGKPTNLDEHGNMSLSNVDRATAHMANAAVAPGPRGVVAVLTRSYDSERSGTI